MAASLKDKKIGTLILIVLLGIIIGALLSALVAQLLPGGDSVVKTFFTYPITFGVGEPVSINLIAIKLQFGMQFQFSMLSIVGVFLSLYFFRWYK